MPARFTRCPASTWMALVAPFLTSASTVSAPDSKPTWMRLSPASAMARISWSVSLAMVCERE